MSGTWTVDLGEAFTIRGIRTSLEGMAYTRWNHIDRKKDDKISKENITRQWKTVFGNKRRCSITLWQIHCENMPMHYLLIFHGCKNDNFQMIFFFILAKHIECGYSLEPPHRGGSNEYPHSMCLAKIRRKKTNTPVNPSFTIYKWGVRGYTLFGHVCMMLMFACL